MCGEFYWQNRWRGCKGISSLFPVRCSPESSQISPFHTGPGFWSLHWPWPFPPVVLPQSWWCTLSFKIILICNFCFPVKGHKALDTFMVPKIVGPQRRTRKLFKLQIYLCSPQMTTFLFENSLLSCPRECRGRFLSIWEHLNQGRSQERRNQHEGALLPILQIHWR